MMSIIRLSAPVAGEIVKEGGVVYLTPANLFINLHVN